MCDTKRLLAGALVLSIALEGCSAFVPEKDLLSNDNVPTGTPSPAGLYENRIVGHIRCELREGVRRALVFPEVQWLKRWGATVTLKISVDELGGLSPGVSILQPLKNAQSFTFGVGVSGSTHTSRVETISFTLAFDELLKEPPTPCEGLQNGILIDSDLKIAQFIYDKAVVASVGEATNKSAITPPFETFQEDLTFIASFGGNLTPTWKFTRVAVDPNSPLLNATRTSNNDVLITLAAVAKKATPGSPAQLSQAGRDHHNAGLVSGLTASQIQSQTH